MWSEGPNGTTAVETVVEKVVVVVVMVAYGRDCWEEEVTVVTVVEVVGVDWIVSGPRAGANCITALKASLTMEKRSCTGRLC